MFVLGACGDDDGVSDSGVQDAMPDSPIEAGTGACDGPYQHPLYVMPFEGTCLGPARAVPGSCVTGNNTMTGNGELWCTVFEGVLHAYFLQFGEGITVLGDERDDAGVYDQQACEAALSQLEWPLPGDESDGGVACFTTQNCIPYCASN